MNLLIPGDLRSGKVPPRVLHNAVLPRSDPREYTVFKVDTRQGVSQLDSDFVFHFPSPPPPTFWELRRVLDTASVMLSLD